MRGFWKREHGLEAELRAYRSEPREEFVRTLAARVPASSRRTGALRAAVAAGLTVAMLGSVAGFGGVGYAAAPAKQVAKVVKKVFVPRGVSVTKSSAAQQQYGGPAQKVTICHRRPDGTFVTMTIPASQLATHLRHGDKRGACKKRAGRIAGVQTGARPSFTG